MYLARVLMLLSAVVVLALGTIHLVYTFRSNKFDPRDAQLKERMQEVSPRLTSQTTMWRAWVGFNASHSMGAMLFGLVYGYLALAHAPVLFDSWFLQGLGLALLAAFTVLGWVYWFSVPFRGIVLALVFYCGAILAHIFATVVARAQ